MVKRPTQLAGAAGAALPAGVALLHLEELVFEAMLRGWSVQQRALGEPRRR